MKTSCFSTFVYWVLGALTLIPAIVNAEKFLTQQDSFKSKPNFIIFFCDNLGYEDVEPFGSQVNKTPFLNKMAKEGRIFNHFYVTAEVCTPTRASIMTGCYAQRVGMHMNPRDGIVLRPISPFGMHPDEVTLAEVLKDRAYQTGIIGKWHLGDQAPFLPTEQGFDYFYGIPYSDDITQETGQRLKERLEGNQWPPLPLMWNKEVIEAGVDRNLLTKTYTEKALQFIETNQDSPFFLYLPQAMPGSTTKPFASDIFRGKSRGGPWGDSVEELDWSIGQIMQKEVELGIAGNTLLVFTSDNGAPMTEDLQGFECGTNKPLYGRGYTTSEGGFRVPTIMWWPGTIPSGTECDELATTMDLLPTFATLSGGAVPTDRIIDGKDISPLLFSGNGNIKSPHTVFYYFMGEQLQPIRWGQWKLFLPLEEFSQHPHFAKGKGTKPLLYDVLHDIGSTRNVAEHHPKVVDQMMALAEKAREDLGDRDHLGARVALVGIDLLFVTRSLVQEARAEIEKRCGIPQDAIMIGASHSHSSGPIGMREPGDFENASPLVQDLVNNKSIVSNSGYMQLLKKQIVEAVVTPGL